MTARGGRRRGRWCGRIGPEIPRRNVLTFVHTLCHDLPMTTTAAQQQANLIAADIVDYRGEYIQTRQDVKWYVEEEGVSEQMYDLVFAAVATKMGL